LQIRIGVHTGEVVVQAIEHGIYQTYDAAGTNVHLANRLEQMADAGGILVSKETYTAAKHFVEVDPLGLKTIRGIAAPLEVFKLRGFQHAPSSGVFRSGRRLSPLTGRNDQLSVLALELENTIKGEFLGLSDPLLTAIKLDPKTRKALLLEFVRISSTETICSGMDRAANRSRTRRRETLTASLARRPK
jgi:Adenylate and Guanylate cyclase catalytic domain